MARTTRRWRRSMVPDLLLPLSLTLWGIGVAGVETDSIDQYGLVSALPLVYFAALVLLIASTGVLLARRELSAPRLAVHLAALIFMIHGTAPLVYEEARYAWAYKHVGVVNYVNVHGALDASIDIYHNWPGFFAVAAWFGRIAGIDDPLTYAAWAQLFFNLLASLELGFVLRALPLTARERWLGLFVFVVGNWVGQDYFAPQALGFVLSLGVFAIALHWLRDDRTPGWTTWIGVRRIRIVVSRILERLRRSTPHPALDEGRPATDVSRTAAIVVLLGVYAVLVFTHELSPYVVAIQMTALTVIGRIRPRWVMIAMWGVCLAYLLPRFAIVDETHHIVTALTNPFQNVEKAAKPYPPGLPGRQLAANAARALALTIWALALLGALRRVRLGRPVAAMLVLAFSPILVVFVHSYGGEAVYRTYLFSLPWSACLAGSLLASEPDSAPRLARFVPPVALLATVSLLYPAFFGMDMAYVMPPAEVRASRYLYSHAEPGSVIVGSPNFPTRLAANYDEFVINPNGTDPYFLDPRLWGRRLGVHDLPILANKIRSYADGGPITGYVLLSTSQANAATLWGILPEGSLESLEQALLDSPDWSVFYRNSDTTVFQLLERRRPSPDRQRSTEAAPSSTR